MTDSNRNETTTLPPPLPLPDATVDNRLNLYLIEKDQGMLEAMTMVLAFHADASRSFRVVGSSFTIPTVRVMERVDLVIFCPEQLGTLMGPKFLAVELSQAPFAFENCRHYLPHTEYVENGGYRTKLERFLKSLKLQAGVAVGRGDFATMLRLTMLIRQGMKGPDRPVDP
jgi:hypothetical protein